jgi:hypothetical protein
MTGTKFAVSQSVVAHYPKGPPAAPAPGRDAVRVSMTRIPRRAHAPPPLALA